MGNIKSNIVSETPFSLKIVDKRNSDEKKRVMEEYSCWIPAKTPFSLKIVDEGNSDEKNQDLEVGSRWIPAEEEQCGLRKSRILSACKGFMEYRLCQIPAKTPFSLDIVDKRNSDEKKRVMEEYSCWIPAEKGEVGSHWRPAENQDKEVGSRWRPAEEVKSNLQIIKYPIIVCDCNISRRSILENDILSALKGEVGSHWRPAENQDKEVGSRWRPVEFVDTPGLRDSDSKIDADMQKMHVLKQKGLLEEELNWQDISLMAHNLYMGGHLKYLKRNQIQDRSQPRRKAVMSLIDAIIGNPSAVSAFMRIMESESRFSYILEKITRTHVAAAELERGLTEDHLLLIWETNQILNNKRKCLSFACEYPAAQKRMKINESEPVKEKKIVKSLRIAIVGQKLWNQVSKHLDLEFKEAFKRPFEDEE